MKPEEHKLDKLWFDPYAIIESATAENPEIVQIADIFRMGVLRVHEMFTTPAMLSATAARYQRALDVALLKHTGSLDLSKQTEFSAELHLAIRLSQKQIVQEEELADIIEEARLSAFHRSGGQTFLGFIEDYEGATYVEALLSSLIISSWTVLETMFGDLWEAAVNLRPAHLSMMRANHTSGKNDEVDSKSFTQEQLSAHGFDVSKVMGTLLREKLKFINLKSIDSAYTRAFYRDSEEIKSTIKDDSLVALFSIRNVLVHKAGRVDSRFSGDRKKSTGLAKWRNVPPGEVIRIDGADTKMLIEPAFKAGAKLLAEVDQWINKHPDSTAPKISS